jgi:hypothetical protein
VAGLGIEGEEEAPERGVDVHDGAALYPLLPPCQDPRSTVL